MPNKKTKKKPAKLKKPATKKRISNKRTQAKKTARKKLAPKKAAAKKKPAAKRKPATKKPALKKAVPRTKVAAKKTPAVKKISTTNTTSPATTPVPRRERPVREAFANQGGRARAAGQSGDLQGLSDAERADSESVDELVEEGNAFEADVIAGVEDADDSDEKEVHTHEVPEDDVPGEYLDED
jgi:hypothetical protein